jgi:N-methylhydantoinase A
MCALGCLVADLRADFVATIWQDCAELTTEDVRRAYARLETDGRDWLSAQRVETKNVYLLRSADMCYVGQSFDVNVPLPDTELSMDEMVQRFHARHTAIYGHADPSAPARLMTARVQIVGVTSKPPLGQIASHAARPPAGSQHRAVYENGTVWDADVYARDALHPGDRVTGPVIVEQYDTTTYVPDGFEVHVDDWLNLIGEKTR